MTYKNMYMYMLKIIVNGYLWHDIPAVDRFLWFLLPGFRYLKCCEMPCIMLEEIYLLSLDNVLVSPDNDVGDHDDDDDR